VLAEVARVLRPGGRFVLFTNHPLFQTPGSGWIDDQILDPPEQYWRVGEYLTEVTTVERVDADVLLPFAHRTLGHYVNSLAAAGLLVDHLDEPSPPAEFLAQDVRYAAAGTIPRLMVLRSVKR
jgi:SAM-dependent methyltransferase